MPSSDLETLLGAKNHPKGMSKRSENIVHRLFARQISHPRPNTHIHQARTLYENIVPGHTIYDVECPDQNFRKFTNDGQYLICFSRNHQDVVVYRHKWLNFCLKGDSSDQLVDLPPKANKFDSHFSMLYSLPLASGTEIISKDFFLSTENGLYGIFATSTVLNDNSSPASDGAVPGVPSTDKITIFLVSLAEGRITDQRSFHDDFIHLAHNMGMFLYDDLLAILSIRFQCIRILQIRETGRFVDVRTIGTHCREDDELVLNSQTQEEESYHKRQASLKKTRGLSQHDVSVSGNKIAKQGKPWPPLWNMKQQHPGQSTRRDRHRRQTPVYAHGSNNTVASAHPPRSENGHGGSDEDDPSTSGAPNANGNGDQLEIHEADLDLQYENYFRGLLATLEDTAVNEVGNHANRSNNAHMQGPLNARPSQEVALSNGHNSGGGGEQHLQQNGQFSSSERGVRSRQNSGGAVGEVRTTYGSLDASGAHAGRNHSEGSTSTSGGGHYSSAGPSRLGRSSYTSTTSGSSLDRHTSGRGSSSAFYTSTTMSSSESESRSEGGSRRDVSFSGGSLGYGNGRATGSGSVIAQSENGSFVEYVVSSRTQGAATVVSTTSQQVASVDPASLPSSSLRGASDRRSPGGGLDLGENGDVGTSSTANGGHSHETNMDEPNSDDRTLPSRPVERSTTSVTTANRADVNHNETARWAHLSGRDGINNSDGNGNRGRPSDGDNGGGSGEVQRNRPAVDPSAGRNEGGRQVLGGIKQRLLSFIFQGVVNEDVSPITKAQRLKRFYYHFQHYVDLVMWKVQFLDRYHLLIKFGSVDGVLQRNSDTSHQTAFLAIFNLETTEMLGFYQNSSEEFLLSFEQFCDHFRVAPRYPLYMNFISSYSNNCHVRDQLRKQRMACSSSKTGNYLQVVKRTLAWVPFNSQCQSPAAYFDQSLFHYDEKLISAIDRHKPCVEHPIKFISRRKPNCLKFKLSPGPENGTNDGRTKRVASFIFHPIFPFAISVQQSFLQPPVINFHFRK